MTIARRIAAAAPPVGAGEHILEGGQIEQAQDLGPLARALQGAPVDDVGEAEKGAGDGGAGDAADSGLLALRQVPRMSVNSRLCEAFRPSPGCAPRWR